MQNLRQLWAESAKKRADDHRLQFRAMGAEDIVSEAEVEMPGDISIKGDESHYHQHIYPGAPAATPTPTAITQSPAPNTAPQPAPTPVRQPANGFWKYAALPIIGGALLGTGAAGAALYSAWTHRPETVTTINQPTQTSEWKLGVRVTDKP